MYHSSYVARWSTEREAFLGLLDLFHIPAMAVDVLQASRRYFQVLQGGWLLECKIVGERRGDRM